MNKDTELPAHTAVRQEWSFSWYYILARSLACFPIWCRKQNLQSFPTPPEETTGVCLLLLGDDHRRYSVSSRSFLCCWWREISSSRRDSEQNPKAAVLCHIWKGLSFSTDHRGIHGNGPYQTKDSLSPECMLSHYFNCLCLQAARKGKRKLDYLQFTLLCSLGFLGFFWGGGFVMFINSNLC